MSPLYPTSIPEQKRKFRNLSGARLLQGLFYEMNREHSSDLYTLKDWDHKGLPSLYRLYMEMDDQTEYEFANKYLDGWEHWCMLCDTPFFKPYVERWRHELYLKNAAQSLNRIKREAKSTSKESFMANRYLLERGWISKDEQKKQRVGRPSKEDIQKEIKEQAFIQSSMEDDLKRMQEGPVN